MQKINWGIIGCGDVTEMKSGPAFGKSANSTLVAVMRRDAAKASDYARRHGVPKWYADANQLINDPEVTAVYVATPPSSHEEYAIAALEAGKPVYVEKPMAVNSAASRRMAQKARDTNQKLVVAHYRREQPLFRKVKQLLVEGAIGIPRLVDLRFFKRPLTEEEMRIPKTSWRLDASVSGGGLFHDLAPHQIDLLYFFFGKARDVSGFAGNQAGLYDAADIVAGTILFQSGVVCSSRWCFSVPASEEKDECVIIGSKGTIRFSVFGHEPVVLTKGEEHSNFVFDRLPHVQQPMIEAVNRYFLGSGTNPCTGDEGAEVMELMEGLLRM